VVWEVWDEGPLIKKYCLIEMVREGVFLGEKKKTHKSFEMELYKK
jgi:hypothetical protein